MQKIVLISNIFIEIRKKLFFYSKNIYRKKKFRQLDHSLDHLNLVHRLGKGLSLGYLRVRLVHLRYIRHLCYVCENIIEKFFLVSILKVGILIFFFKEAYIGIKEALDVEQAEALKKKLAEDKRLFLLGRRRQEAIKNMKGNGEKKKNQSDINTEEREFNEQQEKLRRLEPMSKHRTEGTSLKMISELRKREQELLSQMTEHEKDEYARREAAKDNGLRRQRGLERGASQALEMRRLAEEQVRSKVEQARRLDFFRSVQSDMPLLKSSQSVSRAFVFSYFELVDSLANEQREENGKEVKVIAKK